MPQPLDYEPPAKPKPPRFDPFAVIVAVFCCVALVAMLLVVRYLEHGWLTE